MGKISRISPPARRKNSIRVSRCWFTAAAAATLVKLGFADVRQIEGGILAWEKAGQPIVKPE